MLTPSLLRTRVSAAWVAAGSIGSEKVTETAVVGAIDVAPLAGALERTAGATVSGSAGSDGACPRKPKETPLTARSESPAKP